MKHDKLPLDEAPLSGHLPNFETLLEIVSRLRGEQGCPWDRKQTPATLKKYLLEECQELLEAIDQQQDAAICEEIGDVMFLLVFLISMYTERNQFTAGDVFDGIISKMIRRHPHVFAGLQVKDEHDLQAQWQRIKQQEKGLADPRP